MSTLMFLFALLVFCTSPISAGAGNAFLEIHIDPEVENQTFYTSTLDEIVEGLALLPPELLPGVEEKKIKVVIFSSLSFQQQFAPEGSDARWLFENFPDYPNSGLDDALWVNEASSAWQEFSSTDKRLYMAGEIFRALQARLGVDVNDRDSFDNIPDWLWFGGPLSWSSSFLSDGKEAIKESRLAYEEVGVEREELDQPGSIAPLYREDQRIYGATLYMAEQFVKEHGGGDHSQLLEYYRLLGQGTSSQEALTLLFSAPMVQK